MRADVVVVPSFELGGAEVHAARVVKLLERRGDVVAVAPEGMVADRLRAECALVRTVPRRGRRATLLSLAATAALARPRLAVVVLPYPDRVGVALGVCRAERRVVIVHCLPETVGLDWQAPAVVPGAIGGAIERRLFRSFDRVIAVDAALVEPLVRRMGIDASRVRVVPNAAPDRPHLLRQSPPPIRALVLGRLSREKRVDLAIAAVARAGSRGLELEIVGDGPLRADLTAHVERLGIASRVRFRGAMIDPSSAIASSHVLLFPSEREASPVAPLEAMATGLGVIAADAPHVRNALPSRGVVYASMGDVAAWARALDAFAADPVKLAALGDEAREAVRRERSDATWQAAMLDAIEG